jgi:hypothetical protein
LAGHDRAIARGLAILLAAALAAGCNRAEKPKARKPARAARRKAPRPRPAPARSPREPAARTAKAPEGTPARLPWPLGKVSLPQTQPAPRPRPRPPGAGPLDEDFARLWRDGAYLGRQARRAVAQSTGRRTRAITKWIERRGGLIGQRVAWRLPVERAEILPPAQAAERHERAVAGLKKLEDVYKGMRRRAYLDSATERRFRRDLQALRAYVPIWKAARSGGGGYVLAGADGLKVMLVVPPRLYGRYQRLQGVGSGDESIEIAGRITRIELYPDRLGALWVEVAPDG